VDVSDFPFGSPALTRGYSLASLFSYGVIEDLAQFRVIMVFCLIILV
jgi:hypothetical protein